MAAFGLLHVGDTKVGDEYIRGLSGGERKRTSIAEAVLAGAPLMCWDNSTRGLDAAAALEFVKYLNVAVEIGMAAAFVALYQANQETYEQFGKVTLLYEGRQIFYGDTSRAKEYFEEMGFSCKERMSTPDFLTSLTSPSERVVRDGFEDKVPQTPAEFEARWIGSLEYANLKLAIKSYHRRYPIGGQSVAIFRQSREAEQARLTRSKSPYTISYFNQIALCTRRGFQRLKGDMELPLTTIIGNTILAFIFASIFYNLQPNSDTFFSRGVIIFFSVLFNTLTATIEILSLYIQRPIVEKQSRYAFYHPSAEAVSSFIVDLPTKVVSALGFNIVIYFLTNLRREPGPFFIFFLFGFLCTLVMSSVFRTMSCVTKSLEQAMTPATMTIIVLVATTGFVIPPIDIPPWIKWLKYINPMSYAYEALMINEFRHRTFDCLEFVPSGESYENISNVYRSCTSLGSEPGMATVSGNQYLMDAYGYNYHHLWRNLGIVLAFFVFFSCTYIFASEKMKTQESRGEILVFPRGHRNLKKLASDEETIIESSDVVPAPKSPSSQITDEKQNTMSKGVFHWRNVCFDLTAKSKRRLLENVDGYIRPGTLTALMGASGAGKTTLLDVLASRATVGVVSGDIFVNGRSRNNGFQRKTGYVQQQDVHLPTTTVREALQFSALLRQPIKYSKSQKLAYVEEVIGLLEMEKYADAVVGVLGQGLNIEQRKCLSIAVELAARPELLLFLDEPTSGLDSQTAWNICKLLKKLTLNGQAILCTIHQPSAILLDQFDRLLLLQKGGQTVYFGELGERGTKLVSYLERNCNSKCPPEGNPADWMLTAIGAGPGMTPDRDWYKIWRDSPEYKDLQKELEELENQDSNITYSREGESTYASTFTEQFYLLTIRFSQQLWRTPSYIYSKLALCLLTPLFVGFTFWKSPETHQGLQNQMFSIFTVMVVFGPLIEQLMPHFVLQRSIFETREHPSRVYSWHAFMFSNIVSELPWQTIMSVLCFLAYYYPVGYYRETTPERTGLFFMLMWVFFLFASTFGHLLIAAVDLPDTGGSLANLLFILCLIFCGILATPEQLPRFWIFMYRVSPLTYLVAGFMAAGLSDLPIHCSPSEFVRFPAPSGMTCGEFLAPYLNENGGVVQNPLESVDLCEYCSITSANEYLETIHSRLSDGWRNFGIMWAYVFFNVLCALAIFYFIRLPKVPKPKSSKKAK